jgi:BMFP domain-containing protein YqiC
MQKENQLFEDIARLLSSVTGTLAGAGREAEVRLKERLREAVGGLDYVSREEFEAVKAMAYEARAEVAALKAEMAASRESAAAPRSRSRKTAEDA